MIVAIDVVTPPAEEPVTVDEVRAHARTPDTAEANAVLADKLKTARVRGERLTRRSFLEQTLDVWLDRWDGVGVIELPRGKVLSVVSVTTFDDYNDPTIADTGIYDLVGENTLLFRNWLPPFRRSRGIRVRITSGYGADPEDVPQDIREGILQYAAFLYEHRLGEAPEVKYAVQAGSNLPSGVYDKWIGYQIPMV